MDTVAWFENKSFIYIPLSSTPDWKSPLILFVCLCPCTFKCSTRLVSGANCAIRKITTTNRRGFAPVAHIQEAITEHKHFSNIHIYISLHLLWWGYTTSPKAIKTIYVFFFCNFVPHRALEFKVLLQQYIKLDHFLYCETFCI